MLLLHLPQTLMACNCYNHGQCRTASATWCFDLQGTLSHDQAPKHMHKAATLSTSTMPVHPRLA